MRPNITVQRRTEAVTQSIQTIERRINELGVSEPTVAPYGIDANQILVQLPGLSDIKRAKNIIGQTAVLELTLVEAGPRPIRRRCSRHSTARSRPTSRSSAARRPADGPGVLPGCGRYPR